MLVKFSGGALNLYLLVGIHGSPGGGRGQIVAGSPFFLHTIY